MVLQLDPPAPSDVESLSPPLRRIGTSRPDEPRVPVYRHFLSGDASLFQPSASSKMVLVGASLVGLPLALTMAGPMVSPAATIGSAISAALVSLPLAALVTCWAGRSSGMLAGLLTLAGWTALSCCVAPALVFAAAAVVAAILVYGLAELPNRTATFPRAPAAVTFYIVATLSCSLAGLAPLAPIAAVCLGAVFGSGNSRGIRFFVSPVGLAVLLMGLTIRILTMAAAGPHDPAQWFGLPRNLSPLWPAVVCLALGVVLTRASVRTGHGASPLGRLLISWLLGPALLAAVGVIPTELAVAITLPAWAAMMGPALVGLRRRFRARRKRKHSTGWRRSQAGVARPRASGDGRGG